MKLEKEDKKKVIMQLQKLCKKYSQKEIAELVSPHMPNKRMHQTTVGKIMYSGDTKPETATAIETAYNLVYGEWYGYWSKSRRC